MFYTAKDAQKMSIINKNGLKNKSYNQANLYNNQNLQAPNKIYNIKVNAFKNKPKEKIIEGELNFNYSRINHNKIMNNTGKPKKNNRNMPRKSPIPVPKERAANLLPYQKYFINNKYYMQNHNLVKPKSAFPHKTNNLLNKNSFKPNPIAKNPNFPSNKTYNTFNLLKKSLQRTNSPILHSSGSKNSINMPQKGAIKTRYVSKSPILLKGSIFNRYKIYGFGSSSNNNLMNSVNNNQRIKKKTPIKNNQKKITNHQPPKQGYPNYNNINNIRGKGQTLISGEIIQENNGKFNLNLNNSQNNNVIINMKPLYNPQSLKIESNNALLNIQAEPIRNQNNYRPIKKEKENADLNIMNNANNIIINNQSNIQSNNQSKNPTNYYINPINNENKENNNNNSEIKKNEQIYIAQGPSDIIRKNEQLKEKENEIEKESLKKSKEISNEKKIITKKIKDILPYTHVGFDGEEPKENNQDNYFIYKNFMGNKDYIYMSVCDGHGVEGHFVSDFIKETLPHDMSENLKNTNILTETQKAHSIITQTFLIANEKLVDNEEINSLFSGSTCVSVIYTPQKLIVPNIGDSRAVLGRLNKENGTIKAIDLSRDHKPTEKDEAQRIIENDGRIQPFIEEGEFVGPERVWIKEEEVPGLAMTRSFGDRVAATVGVMSEPEIKEFDFCEEDRFMIIASDGIWEFISSQECVNIINEFYEKNDLKGCCEYLYQESSKRWLKEEEVIDDTTLILVFFE